MRLKITENEQDFFVKFIRSSLTVGRSSKADIKVNCQHVSSLHCQFRFDPSMGLFLLDLESMNGTFVDEKQILTETQVYLSNKIRIGEILITIDDHKLSTRELELLKAS